MAGKQLPFPINFQMSKTNRLLMQNALCQKPRRYKAIRKRNVEIFLDRSHIKSR